MMTLEQLLQSGESRLFKAGIEDAEIDAWYLLEHSLSIDRVTYFLNKNTIVTQEETEKYFSFIEKRATHIPLQQLTKEQEFMGFSFSVNEHVLIPRQDTEVLVEEVQKAATGKRVLDLCTGTGCIILSLAKLCSLRTAVGVDISQEALKVARENQQRLQVEVTLLQSDLFENITGTFDIIVSNPPYIPTQVIETLMPEVKDHEPVIALDGKEDGLYFYRKIVKESRAYLASSGQIFFEIGCEQGTDVADILKSHGFTEIRVLKDLCGLERVVTGIKKEAF